MCKEIFNLNKHVSYLSSTALLCVKRVQLKVYWKDYRHHNYVLI
jgi:hypothetical protein